MAETLVGDHYAFTCDDCRFPFRCGAEGIRADDLITCPNCGFPKNKVTADRARPGQRVIVDRFPLVLAAPKRWQIVALRRPDKPDELSVKRVVGLPGERVAIRRGDVVINDQVIFKPLALQKEFRLPVHDDRFRPQQTKDLPPRWAPEASQSGWRADESSYSFSPLINSSTDDAHAFDWLVYQHWRGFSNPLPRADASPVLDNDSYCPNDSRPLNEVTDLVLSFRATVGNDTVWGAAIDNGRHRYVVRLSALDKSYQCEQDGVTIAKGSSPFLSPGAEQSIEFLFCDEHIAMTINGVELFRSTHLRSAPANTSDKEVPPPCAIGVGKGTLRVRQLQMGRDIYYLPLHNRGEQWQRDEVLGKDEYFVLGDNPAISVDSRDPEYGVVKRSAIMGQVRGDRSP